MPNLEKERFADDGESREDHVVESPEEPEAVRLVGVLAAFAEPRPASVGAALDVLDVEEFHRLCCLVDDDGPDTERESAVLGLSRLARREELRGRIETMLEDARTFGVFGARNRVAVYDVHCIRNHLLALVAQADPETAARIAREREVHWPDRTLWPKGLPDTLAAFFAVLTAEADEERVGPLGRSWLDSGVLSEALDARLRPIFQVLVDFRTRASLQTGRRRSLPGSLP